jgi:hypothetical protein
MAFENRKSALNLRARVGDSERLARCPVSDKAVYQALSQFAGHFVPGVI